MSSLLAYGSLMHPGELAHLQSRPLSAMPVRVRGYRRSFCQRPSWRRGQGERRGVLTVHPAPGDWFNAILLGGLDLPALSALDERERGYVRLAVPRGRLEPYPDSGDRLPKGKAQLYTGRPELYDDALLPNPEYLRICTEAASRWGDVFLEEFLATTYCRGRPLAGSDPGGDTVAC